MKNNNAQNPEPVLPSTSQNMENNTIPLCTSVAATSGIIAWPPYGLTPGYIPPGFAPPISSQTNLGIIPSVLQNPLYQSLPLLATSP